MAMLGLKKGLAGALFGCQGTLQLGKRKRSLASSRAEARGANRDLLSGPSPVIVKLFIAGKFFVKELIIIANRQFVFTVIEK